MDRKEFLQSIGIGAAFVLTASCLHSCNKTVLPAVDFSINLSDAENASLATLGNYIIKNDVVIARKLDGGYAAATLICSHEQEHQITYSASNEWFCTAHGARYDLNGNGLNSNGSNGLTIYKTDLSGTTLHIFE